MATSELTWKLVDYRRANVDPPARIVSNPDLTEGEMMSDDEVEELIKDSIATLRILSDRRSARFDEIMEMFQADMAYLAEIGRLAEDDYAALVHPDNLRF